MKFGLVEMTEELAGLTSGTAHEAKGIGELTQTAYESHDSNEHRKPAILVIDRQIDVPDLVQVDATSVCIKWCPVPLTVHSTQNRVVDFLVSFELEMQQIKGSADSIVPDGWCTQYSGPATHVQVKGLHPGRTYALRVCCNPVLKDDRIKVEHAPPSEPLIFETKSSCPSAMLPPMLVARGQNHLVLKWAESEEDGGHEVLEYILEGTLPLEYQNASDIQLNSQGMYEIYRGHGTNFTWSNLSPGTRYNVRIKAVNCIGTGAASSIASFVTQSSVPNAPVITSCTSSTPNMVEIEWSKPAANGAEIESYFVELDDGDGSFRRVARVCVCSMVVAKLKSDTLHKIRVCAENAEGCGLWSPVVSVRTLSSRPVTPRNLTHKRQNSMSIFSWESGQNHPNEEFILEINEIGRNKSQAPQKHQYRVSGTCMELGTLKIDSKYSARVKSVISGKDSHYSKKLILKMKAEVLESPDNLRIREIKSNLSEDRHAYDISWSRGQTERDISLVYEVQIGVINISGKSVKYEGIYLGEDCSCTVDGLQDESIYAVRVRELKDGFFSEWSPVVEFETSKEILKIKNFRVNRVTPLSLLLEWDDSSVSDSVLQYEAEFARICQFGPFREADFVRSYSGNKNKCIISDLSPETLYLLRVRACSQHSTGPWSEEIGAETGIDLLKTPQNFSVTSKSKNELSLDWTLQSIKAMQENCFLELEIARLNHPSPTIHKIPICDSHVVSNLSPSTRYTCRIRVCDSKHCGVWSPLVVAQTCSGPPDTPESPEAVLVGGGNAFKLSWNYPNDNGSLITEFDVSMSENESFSEETIVYRGPDVSFKISQLSFGSKYFVRIRALNSLGYSSWSNHSILCTQEAPPEPPSGISCKVQDGDLFISWKPNVLKRCAGYEIELSHTNESSSSIHFGKKTRIESRKSLVLARRSCRGSESNCVLPRPRISGQLSVRVRSVGINGIGHGQWSNPIIFSHVFQTKPSRVEAKGENQGLSNANKEHNLEMHSPSAAIKGKTLHFEQFKVAKKPKKHKFHQTKIVFRNLMSSMAPSGGILVYLTSTILLGLLYLYMVISA